MTSGITPSVNERFVPPDLAEFLSRRMRDIGARLNCHTVGTIQSFDKLNQTATVLVNFQKIIRGVNPLNNVAGSSDMLVDYPTLVNVPIIFLNGGGGYLTFPITAGDTCLLLFCDRDMDVWLDTGQVAPPNSDRVHDINDAVALVGIRDFQNVLSGYSDSQVVLGFPTGLISVTDRTGERLAQSGDLKVTARSTAPSGWVLAYGQSLSKTTYPDLFAAIGYTFGGSGDNFNVPDMRGRTAAGLDNMGGTNANVLTNAYTPDRNTLGAGVGEETHTLTIAEMPAHTHTYTKLETPGAGNSGGSHDVETTANTGSTGGGDPHYNVQPSRMLNWVIKL